MTDVQMDRTLSSEQKRIDFRPPEDLPPPLDRPTDACLFATALLTAAAKSAQQALQGSNGSAFTSEVSQLHALPPCCKHDCSLHGVNPPIFLSFSFLSPPMFTTLCLWFVLATGPAVSSCDCIFELKHTVAVALPSVVIAR